MREKGKGNPSRREGRIIDSIRGRRGRSTNTRTPLGVSVAGRRGLKIMGENGEVCDAREERYVGVFRPIKMSKMGFSFRKKALGFSLISHSVRKMTTKASMYFKTSGHFHSRLTFQLNFEGHDFGNYSVVVRNAVAGSMPPSKPNKKPPKPPSQQPPTEGSVQGGSSKGKQPIRPPTEKPFQFVSGSKNPRQLSHDKSTQTDFEVVLPRPAQQVQSGTGGKQRQDPPIKQWVQSKPKGKRPMSPISEHPVEPEYTSENVQGGSSKGKQPVRPPTKQPVQAGSESKNPQQLPLHKPMPADPEVVQPRPEQRVKSGTEVKQREDPSVKQRKSKGKQPIGPPLEHPGHTSENVQGGSNKGKQPIQPPTEHSVKTDYTSENVQGGSNKGKQPVRPPIKQPVQAASGSTNPEQVPLDKSIRVDPEVTQPRPEHVESDTEGKQRQDLPAKPSEESKSKGKQPMSKPVYGNPRRLIARIPVKKNARIKRVEVSIGPDTAFRHPQTFFFKNLPMLEPYWGWTNDKAFTATRIVRLEKERKPTPYFLMVCRGEYPKVKSPRNDNAIFKGMYEPIFGDAFVFKLGDPELYGDGYARYIHIEEDIGSIDWMPEAIRVAARRVDMAMAPEANPGFPDLDKYADRETISKDSERMLNWMRAIKNATNKYARPFPVDAASGLPDLERMQDIIKKWTRQIDEWKRRGVISVDDSTEPTDVQKLEDFVQKTIAAYKATLDEDTDDDATEDEDKTVSASTDTGSSDTETTDDAEDIQERFLAARAAFLQVEAIAKKNINKKLLSHFYVVESSGVTDLKKIKAMLDQIMTTTALWKEENALRPEGEVGCIDPKTVDEIVAKVQRLYQMMDEGTTFAPFIKAVREVKEIYLKFADQLDEQIAADRANPAFSDFAGHLGTSPMD